MANLQGYVKPGSIEESLSSQIDFTRLPRHIALIMDGNGRWAKARNLPRLSGHRAGIQSVRDVVETCARLEIEYLTLYALSVDNWKRPATEISGLMRLIIEYMNLELDTLIRENIRFRPIGRIEQLDPAVQQELQKGVARTAACTGLNFNIALNYGGRTEIVDGVKRLLKESLAHGGQIPAVDEDAFTSYLYTAGMPDPDLLIRTSGEMRVSNFLLWQIAYAEFYVTETLWPDFRAQHLFEAILHYQRRERRYGGLSDSFAATEPLANQR